MPPILDVAIGIVFIFLLFSLAVSALNEVILSWMDKRAELLMEGLQELFRDSGTTETGTTGTGTTETTARGAADSGTTETGTTGAGATDTDQANGRTITYQDFFKQGMIAALSRGLFGSDPKKPTQGVPSYIPGKSFVLSLLSLVLDKDDAAKRTDLREQIAALPYPVMKQRLAKIVDGAGGATAETLAAEIAAMPEGDLRQRLRSIQTLFTGLKSLRAQIEAIGNVELKQTLLALYDDAAGNLDQFKANLENWFNESMDRVGGWYKRYAQQMLLFLSFVLAVACNVNTIQIVQALSASPALREALVKQAVAYSEAERAKGDGATTNESTEAGEGATPAPSEVNPTPVSSPARASAQTPANSPVVAAAASSSESPSQTAKSLEDKATEAAAKSPELLRFKAALANLQGTGLPLGWSTQQQQYFFDDKGKPLYLHFLTALAGWIITALAASLGAPFWFDTLNRFIDIRGVGRAPEEKDPTAPKKRASEAESYLQSGDAGKTA